MRRRSPFVPGVTRSKWSDVMPAARLHIAANRLRLSADRSLETLQDMADRLETLEQAQREREEAARAARREQAARLRPPR
jgi:hypothetical protein